MAVKRVTVKEDDKPTTVGEDRKGRVTEGPLSMEWYNAEPGRLAAAVKLAADTIAKGGWQRRVANVIYQRFFTDRQVVSSSSYSIVRRPAALHRAVANSRWSPPTFNAISTAADVYSTRIWKNRPFIKVTALAGGGFQARCRTRTLSRFSDAVFEETQFWNLVEEIGQDAMAHGMGVVKVHEDQNNPKHIAISRVDPDELLISEDEALHVQQHSMLQIVFMHRADAMRFAKTEEQKRAIRDAPSIHPSVFDSGDRGHKNIIALLEGWAKPSPDGTPGRHVLVIDGCVLLDDRKYKKRYFPFAVIRFKQIKGSWFGQGLVEQCLPLQRALNRIQAAIDEIQERCAWPHTWAEANSQINIEQMAGVAGGVRFYTGKLPEFRAPDSVPTELLVREQFLINLIQKRAGISDAAVQGTTPPGLTSGRALIAWSQLDDQRHVDLAQRLEDFVTQVAYLVYALAEDIKPKVVLAGKRGGIIDWEDAKLTFDPSDLTSSHFRARAFPMSRLPQTIAGREQQIRDWLDNKQITPEDALRLGVSPDVEGFADLATAADDDIENSLDRLIEEGKWIPPVPFGDPAKALATAQARYLHERSFDGTAAETPRERMDLLARYVYVLKDRVEASAPAAPPAPGPGAAAGGPPAGAPPAGGAPPPQQMAA